MCINGEVALRLNDPSLVQEFYTIHKDLVDKQPVAYRLFYTLLGDSFLFAPNKHWKEKRKAAAHAFYKDKLYGMLENFKEVLTSTFEQWTSEIREK